ncbi:MAG: GNAT family N-acetyltransferase [Lentisphaeria bacterium]|nr:GNAT family N-acetyltransferase [Lentisphaeria bacterium]
MKQPQPDEIVYQVPAVIPPAEAAALYVEAGWMEQPDEAEVSAMLKGTFAVSAAFHEGRLIGFMRAFSDGVSDAYLLDLIVQKEYRRLGIGRNILDRLTAYLKQLGIDWILCIGAPGTEAFYTRTQAGKMTDYTPYRFRS